MENDDINIFKRNIINWYDFKKDANLLGIGKNIEEYSDCLHEKLSQITLIEDFTENIKIEEQFDYILVKDEIQKIDAVKRYLKQDGTILLLLNNRFGIHYFAGDTYEKQLFSTICGQNENLLSKKQIEDVLENQGFSNYKFFYPLPNYQMPNVIFSDDYLPNYADTKLLYNHLYQEGTVLVFDEVEALKQVTKAGQFSFFANSYLVEINPKTQTKFVSFNNARKRKFRLCTKINKDNAIKMVTNEEAQEHIKNMKDYIEDLKNHEIEIIDKFENDTIVSPYRTLSTFYHILVKAILDNRLEEAYQQMENWYDFIKAKFEQDKTNQSNEMFPIKENVINELTIVKKAYIDLVFENTFLEDNHFQFFDQEWCLENLPLEFILYRAINNLYAYHADIEMHLPKKDVFEHFRLVKYLEIFEQIETNFQAIVSDEKMIQAYTNSKKIIRSLAEVDKLLEQNDALSARIRLLEEEEQKKENYIKEVKSELGKVNEDNLRLKQENAVIPQKDKIIDELNAIIKVKEHEIETYENMRAVKLAKKLRGLKNG